ncbi:MAG TPA: right-handed parallel beta-helix repeat-containing protein [Candidatus Hydrogenedentes bacterium]|nr:right-handed parallel beta-helix repeat-containing protein [Candidatus Hydrogenedentota bacterium]
MNTPRLLRLLCVCTLAAAQPAVSLEAEDAAAPAACPNVPLQQLIDAHPGEIIFIPAGYYSISEALRVQANGTGLWGPGTIVQTDDDQDILSIDGVSGVRIEGITLTRAEGRQESSRHALAARNCRDIEIRNVRVINNHSSAGTVYLENCRDAVVSGCTVRNYKRIGVDDRTASELYGYAFRVIDGTGILVNAGRNIGIHANRVIEDRLFPTAETKEEHQLGFLTDGKLPTRKGRLAPPGDYANNWHQGSAIVVTSPEESSHVTVSNNQIQNAAQGIDLHADHVTCTANDIDHAFIGIKCMHGSRNVIIANNNISHMDLWGIIMMPGTASHPAEPATDAHPARGANFTRGNIIANNIFSDFGYGYEHFNWKDSVSGVISLESGQLPENPVMTDVIIQGNIVYDTAGEGEIRDGQLVREPPRYEYAVFISDTPRPERLTFTGNIFPPGSRGISNIPLEEFRE